MADHKLSNLRIFNEPHRQNISFSFWTNTRNERQTGCEIRRQIMNLLVQ